MVERVAWTMQAPAGATFELAIAIPTFNRSAQLASLLAQLAEESADLAGRVIITVSNNASTDSTATVLDAYAKAHPEVAFEAYQQERNIGAVPNIEFLVRHAPAEWVWCMGDDDLLFDGGVHRVLDALGSVKEQLLLVRTAGIPEWNGVPHEGGVRVVRTRSAEGAQCLMAATFLASVVLRAEAWRGVLGRAGAFGVPNYGNWVAALLTAIGDESVALLDDDTVRGNANMHGDVRFEKYGVLILQRLTVWRRLRDGDGAERAAASWLRPLIAELFRRAWRSVASGSDRSLPQRREKLSGFVAGVRLLGWPALRALPWLVVALVMPEVLRTGVMRARARVR